MTYNPDNPDEHVGHSPSRLIRGTEGGVNAVAKVLAHLSSLYARYTEYGIKVMTLSAHDHDTLTRYPTEAQRVGVSGEGTLKYRGMILKRGPGAPLPL